MNNNFNGKNIYIKAGFNIYNVGNTNANMGLNNISSTRDADGINTGNTSNTKDASGTSGAKNNVYSKNPYTKACFNTYNIVGVGISNIYDINKEISIYINNTSANESSKPGKANKNGLNRANKSVVGGINKSGVSRANKNRVSRGKKS